VHAVVPLELPDVLPLLELVLPPELDVLDPLPLVLDAPLLDVLDPLVPPELPEELPDVLPPDEPLLDPLAEPLPLAEPPLDPLDEPLAEPPVEPELPFPLLESFPQPSDAAATNRENKPRRRCMVMRGILRGHLASGRRQLLPNGRSTRRSSGQVVRPIDRVKKRSSDVCAAVAAGARARCE
jgi:hypothetical protein